MSYFVKFVVALKRAFLFDYLDEMRTIVVQRRGTSLFAPKAYIALYLSQAMRCLVLSHQVSISDYRWLYHDSLVAVPNQNGALDSTTFICYAGLACLTSHMIYLLKIVLPRTAIAHLLHELVAIDLGGLQANDQTLITWSAAIRLLRARTEPHFAHSLPSYPSLSRPNRTRIVRILLTLKVTTEAALALNLAVYTCAFGCLFVWSLSATSTPFEIVWNALDAICLLFVSIKMLHLNILAVTSALCSVVTSSLMLAQLDSLLANRHLATRFLNQHHLAHIFNYYHREHVRCVRHIIKGNSHLWSHLALSILVINLPINLYFISYLYKRPLDFSVTFLVACFLCQVAFCAAGFLPIGHMCRLVHISGRHLPRLQALFVNEPASMKMRLAGYFEVLSGPNKISFTVGPLVTITYLSIATFVINYAIYIMQTLNVFA